MFDDYGNMILKLLPFWIQKLSLIHNFLATDQDTTGVWMHSSTGEEVAWFGKKPFKCEHDGNAMIVDFDKRSLYNGRWCTEITTASHRYICKALI